MINRIFKFIGLLVIASFFIACVSTTTPTETTTTTTPTATTTTTTSTETTTTTTTTTTTESTTTTTTIDTISMVALPDLTGCSRVEISQILTNLGLTVRYYFDNSIIYTSDDQYDQFLQYGQAMIAGTEVAVGSEVRVYTSPLNLSLQYLYNLEEGLQLYPEDYSEKQFIADGIGVVTVDKFVDGDTTWFSSGGEGSFSVRYLGIDTPESTALYEAWGKAAANYTRDVLFNAETIVLQSEGERQDGNGRYLAWVWYRNSAEEKFLLLNLELVELAYSKNKVSTGSAFTSILTLADWNASLTKRRVWGEIDPNYDYTKDGTQMSIEFLMNNFDDYVGLKVCVTGTITRMIGDNIFIQDTNGYGVYMYAGFTTSAQLVVGANVTVAGLTPAYHGASPQLTNFKKTNLYINTPIEAPNPLTISYDEFVFHRIGTLVYCPNLTVTYINSAGSSIGVRDENNNTFTVRIESSTLLSASTLGITVGSVISVTCPLGYYDFDWDGTETNYQYAKGDYQLMITSSSDVVILG